MKMKRGGEQVLVPNHDIVVGDVIILQTGDKITADGIVIESNNMVVDEASLTGESEPIKKGSKDPFCRAGTTVSHQCRSYTEQSFLISTSAFWPLKHNFTLLMTRPCSVIDQIIVRFKTLG